MPDRLEEIKNAYAVDATTQPDAFKQSHIGWLIAEVERLREARISDLEEVVRFGKHYGATEHVRHSKGTPADKVIWKAHKLAMGLRFNQTGEKCPGCEGFRWVHV